MGQVAIENPILNSPFEEPGRHFRFAEDGITDEVVEGRRVSSYFVPIPRAKSRGKQAQLALEGEGFRETVRENAFINRVRGRVAIWREGGYPGVTATTGRLLRHWTDPGRERRLFFCQVEALETIVYVTEAAKRFGDEWIEGDLRRFNADANPLLFRLAAKVATARRQWVPAVNNHGGFGRWAFLDIVDPWNAQRAIRAFVEELGV